MRSIGEVHAIANVVDSQHVKFAIYWKTALLILLISGLVSILMRFAAQQLIESQNAFSDYGDIMPGEMEQIIEKRGFTCENNPNKTNYYSSDYAVCTLVPESKAFSKIEIVADHDRIVESRFYVHQNVLRYGDLMTSMDISHRNVHPIDLFFFWKTLFVHVQTEPSKLHFALRPIRKVIFTDVHAPNLSMSFPYNSVPDTSNK